MFFQSCRDGKADGSGLEAPSESVFVQPAGLESPPEEAENPGEVLPGPVPMVLNMEEEPDIILAAYRDPALQDGVVVFFRDLTGSQDVSQAVLASAAAFDIPPALAFALCWEESRYKPRAFNRNRNDTVDRGLFQLNSGAFPKLTTEDFYNLDINSRHGLSHLRWCLNTAGTEVAALAMYNAGTARVRSAGTPKNTLDYISRILKLQRRIEEHFIAESPRIFRELNAEAGKGKPHFRLSLLTPLGR